MMPIVRKVLALAAAVAVIPVTVAAQEADPAGLAPVPRLSAATRTFPLWPGSAPGALGDEAADVPRMTFYPGWEPNGTAVIVAPGGGYSVLAMNHEGRQVANWLNAMGVAAFVLEYRLGPRYRHPIPLGDAQRAVRLVRARAAEFGVLTDRIGIMGFSAGGHLAATAATRFDAGATDVTDAIDRASSRPDFLILGYPVISMSASLAHTGSARNLIGDDASEELRRAVSNELHVSADTPATFLFHTTTDAGVPPEHSILFYQALVRAGVPAEMHLFASGPHGVGLALGDPALSQWPTLLANWMRARGWLSRP